MFSELCFFVFFLKDNKLVVLIVCGMNFSLYLKVCSSVFETGASLSSQAFGSVGTVIQLISELNALYQPNHVFLTTSMLYFPHIAAAKLASCVN